MNPLKFWNQRIRFGHWLGVGLMLINGCPAMGTLGVPRRPGLGKPSLKMQSGTMGTTIFSWIRELDGWRHGACMDAQGATSHFESMSAPMAPPPVAPPEVYEVDPLSLLLWSLRLGEVLGPFPQLSSLDFRLYLREFGKRISMPRW